jgi:hypothetical protein
LRRRKINLNIFIKFYRTRNSDKCKMKDIFSLSMCISKKGVRQGVNAEGIYTCLVRLRMRYSRSVACVLLLWRTGQDSVSSIRVAQAVSRRPLTVLAPGSVHVVFVVVRVALGQVCLQVLRVFLSLSFHRVSSNSYIMWGINKRPTDGSSSDIVPPHRHEQQRLCITFY